LHGFNRRSVNRRDILMSQEFAYKELLRRISRGEAQEGDQLWLSVREEPDPLDTDRGRVEFECMVHKADMSIDRRLTMKCYPSYVPDLMAKFRDPYCGWESEIYLLGAEKNPKSKVGRYYLRIWDTQQKLSAMHPPPQPSLPDKQRAGGAPEAAANSGSLSPSETGPRQQLDTPPPAAPSVSVPIDGAMVELKVDTMPAAAAEDSAPESVGTGLSKQQPCGHPLLDRIELPSMHACDWVCTICGKLYEEAGE
jgi:hypothetical protein